MKKTKILILESFLHHKRANIINKDIHFPSSDITYGGLFFYKRGYDFFKKFDLIVATVSTSETANYITKKCKGYGIPTILLCDGVIEWMNMYHNPFLINKNIKLYSKIEQDFFGVMGRLERMYFCNHANVKCINFTPNRILDMNLSKKHCESFFLITTANNPYFNDFEKESCMELLLEAQSVLIKNGIKYKVRIFDSFILDNLIKQDSSIINDINCSFDECLSSTKAMISTPSTIIFNAMMNNIPVCQLQYRDSPLFTQSGWAINKSVDIESAILGMLNPSKERMDFQITVLGEHVSESNLLEEVVSSFEHKKVEVSQGKSVLDGHFVINLEPILRFVDDVIKVYFPSVIKSMWRKITFKLK